MNLPATAALTTEPQDLLAQPQAVAANSDVTPSRLIMRLFQAFGFTLGLCVFLLTFAGCEKTPSPPGYSRVKLKEINATIFMPSGWHVTHTPKQRLGEFEGYDFSLEDPAKKAAFQTRFLIHAYEKIEEHTKLKASAFGVSLLKLHESRGQMEAAHYNYDVETEPFVISRLQTRHKGSPEMMQAFITMANEKTGTCYLLTFRTPADDWPANEKILKQMSQVVFDTER